MGGDGGGVIVGEAHGVEGEEEGKWEREALQQAVGHLRRNKSRLLFLQVCVCVCVCVCVYVCRLTWRR